MDKSATIQRLLMLHLVISVITAGSEGRHELDNTTARLCSKLCVELTSRQAVQKVTANNNIRTTKSTTSPVVVRDAIPSARELLLPSFNAKQLFRQTLCTSAFQRSGRYPW